MPNKSLADDGPAHDAAQFIAQTLKETDAKPVAQIASIVQVLGSETALALLAEVERIETSGGMLLPDGQRRRTPGGVFFYLARKRLPKVDAKRIFPPPRHTPKPEGAGPASGARPPDSSPLKPRPRIVDLEAIQPSARTQTWGGGGRRQPPRDAKRPWQPKGPEQTPAPRAPAQRGTPWHERPSEVMPAWRPAPVTPRPAPELRSQPAEPLSKKDFVLSQPASMPATEVVAAAKRQGLSLSASYVYALRQRHPQQAEELPEKADDQILSAARAQLFSILAEIDPDETATINDVLQAIQTDLAVLTPRKRRQLLAALLLEELLGSE